MWSLALAPLEVHDDKSSSSDTISAPCALRACIGLALHDTPTVRHSAGTRHAFHPSVSPACNYMCQAYALPSEHDMCRGQPVAQAPHLRQSILHISRLHENVPIPHICHHPLPLYEWRKAISKLNRSGYMQTKPNESSHPVRAWTPNLC